MESPMLRRPSHIPVGQPRTASPKVVSIPIHFVSPDSATARSAAARRIQKAVRGFLVRKSVKKIVAIKREVDEIEKKFGEREGVEVIRKDGKERLKVNEMLMRLLFRLDCISGVDFGVRVFWKSVTKKVIMLQERLDQLVYSIQETVGSVEEGAESLKSAKSEEKCEIKSEMVDMNVVVESEIKVGADDNLVDYIIVESELNSEPQYADRVEDEEGTVEMEVEEDAVVVSSTAAAAVEGKKVEDEKKGLMEKMIEKNELLMKMVTDLCESNKLQAEMLNSLAKRVDGLEQKQRSKSKKRRQFEEEKASLF